MIIDECNPILDQLAEFHLGIKLYHQHPFKRKLSAAKVIWQGGATRLLDYGKICKTSPQAKTILFIPSLINKSYILDLMQNRSLIRYLGKNNIRSFLIDWGEPSHEELNYSLENYLTERIVTIIDFLFSQDNQEIILVGYCMGGIMALGASILRQSKVKALVLLATPWDFSCYGQVPDPFNNLEKIPAGLIYNYFCMMDANKVVSKFVEFSKIQQTSFKAKLFVSVEQWVRDGVSLSSKIFTEFLKKQDSEIWQLDNYILDPKSFNKPAYVAISEKDYIVPKESTLKLAELLPRATKFTYPSGHLGMIIGGQAKKQLWSDLVNWVDLL